MYTKKHIQEHLYSTVHNIPKWNQDKCPLTIELILYGMRGKNSSYKKMKNSHKLNIESTRKIISIQTSDQDGGIRRHSLPVCTTTSKLQLKGLARSIQVMKGKDLHPRWLYPAKLSFRMEGKIKCFPDKVKLKEFIITKPLLYDMLKGVT